jgi:hypothetical protein
VKPKLKPKTELKQKSETETTEIRNSLSSDPIVADLIVAK